jgi:hypothetical protein
MAGSSQHQRTPNTPQPVQETRAELNTYQPFSFREPCTQHRDENEFPGMPTSEFNGTEFEGFDLEKWMPWHGEETEQGAMWSEWGDFQR